MKADGALQSLKLPLTVAQPEAGQGFDASGAIVRVDQGVQLHQQDALTHSH